MNTYIVYFEISDDNPQLDDQGTPEEGFVSCCCGAVLYVISILFIAITFPFSLVLCIKVMASSYTYIMHWKHKLNVKLIF